MLMNNHQTSTYIEATERQLKQQDIKDNKGYDKLSRFI